MVDVRLPDGRTLRFPEGMDQGAMAQAIEGLLASERAGGAGNAPPAPPAPPSPPRMPEQVARPRPRTPENADMNYGDQTQIPTETAMFGIGMNMPSTYTQPDQPGQTRPSRWSDVGRVTEDIVASGADGIRQGVAGIAGLPVEAINASPMLLNLLPGEQGIGPISDRPIGGFEDFDTLLRFGGLVEDYEPQTMAGRFTGRIGEEVGATLLPVAALGRVANTTGPLIDAIRNIPGMSFLTRPMERVGRRVMGREAGLAAVAGTGAQIGNELYAGATGQEDGEGSWWSDLFGAMGGVATVPTVATVARTGRNVIGALTGDTSHVMPEVSSQVVDKIIDSSSMMQQQAAEFGINNVDTDGLARALSTQSAAEATIPGFRANVGDRVADPGLSTLAFNVDATTPGAGNLRRTQNAAAVDNTMGALRPEANPATFREALQFGSDARISEAQAAQIAAEAGLTDATAAVQPAMTGVVRGANLRGSLGAAHDAASQNVSDLYAAVDTGQPVDMAGLRDAFDAQEAALPINDRERFSPSEVSVLRRNIVDQDPTPTGVLDMYGAPVMRAPEDTNMPLTEALAFRSGLSSDVRSPSATDQGRRVTGQFMDTFDNWLREVMPAEQVEAADAARAARLDVGRRFEDVGAVPDILRSTGRDQYVMPDEAVAPRALRNETDLGRVIAEVGQDPAARDALADQIRDDAVRANATRSPQALATFMRDRNFALEQFPEVRASLEAAGVSRQQLAEADQILKDTQARYAPGSNSPTGRYLRYDDTGTRQAIATAWRSPQPEAAMRELLTVAGDTPQARDAAKAALWEEVAGAGQLSAPTMASADGVQRWSGRALQNLFADPRFARTAEVLWEDNPEHLSNIRGVVDALSTADSSVLARTPGTSGTPQAMAHDPALSSASIASRLRSVNRGQLSPVIAGVDLAATFLRRSSARVREQAYQELMAEVVNNPDLAADLLRRYNPADEAAFNQRLLGYMGVRAPTVANILAGGNGEEETDPVIDWAGE